MSTTGQFSKNPTIKRILKEAAELSANPSPDYHATPLDDSDLFTWHFTLRGPPAPSPFSAGIYHGSITLPPSYPLKPPNFRFLTPSGRFEVNREICLSISGHHEESWQPAWGIRTALVAIRAFMESDAGGQVGGMSAAENVKLKLAAESGKWICVGCGGKTNEDVLKEQEELSGKDEEAEKARKEKEEMLAKDISFTPKDKSDTTNTTPAESQRQLPSPSASSTPTTAPNLPQVPSIPAPQSPVQSVPAQPVANQHHRPPVPHASRDVWLDRAILGISAALIIMILRQFLE